MNSIPNYTVDALVLHSSEASLQRGRRVDDGAAVLIKTIEPGPGRSVRVARLRHEFQLLRQLDVPGVPRALALETFPGGWALILEPAPGESLAGLFAQGPLDVRSALALGVALSAVLAGVHQRGLVLKRLAPQSILCDLAGPTVCLTDFGAASALSEEPGRSVALGGDMTELAYISPEQTGRINRSVDARSDLYSLGIILYEALSGSTPFARIGEPLTLIHAHIARRPAPLHEVVPGLPEIVSRIVDKLLAKTAEERYHTANGLRQDLLRCLEALDRGAAIPEFALGHADKDGVLRVPQRLYGRDADLAVLLGAFDRVHAGATELMLISGYSGIGKSVLVREINKPAAERGGVFISGKFEQFNRSVPYAALGQAFRELTHLLLCESPATLASWQERIQGALGANGALLLELVPDLKQIVGPQPELPPLTVSEAQHRLEMTLRRFVRALSGPSHPLVLFLDDLQWIDPASLHLVQVLLTDEAQSHLLIVGAYRDHEVDTGHILVGALDTLRKSNVHLKEVTLKPLSPDSVRALLADALDLPVAQVEGLAAALVAKTQGNPFFLGQYLGELCGEKLLRFDAAQQRWVWDMAGIEGRVVAGNVVELVTAKLRRLPPETQQSVTYAAAIGHRFDAATLATILGTSVADAVQSLWPALEASAVVPIGENYRLLARPDLEPGAAAEAGEVRPHEVWFKFIHDRVQQAAYALTAEDRLAGLHREIGRLLLERHGGYAGLQPAMVFETAKHLQRGAALITDPEERLALARLDLIAGRRAKAAAAYEAAAEFLAAGAALLDQSHWDTHHDLMYALHVELGACQHLSGRTAAADAVFEQLVPRAATDLDFADLCRLRGTLYTTEGRYADVITCCLGGLERLGMVLPSDPAEQRAGFMAGVAEIPANLADRPIASLVDAPLLEDPRLQRIVALLSLVTPSAFFTSLDLFCLSLIINVNVSLKHGNTVDSTFAYVSYGFLLIGAFGNYADGYEFGRLGLALNAKFRDTRLACQLHVVFAMGLHHNRPLREVLELNRKGYRLGLESGDMNYLTYGCYASIGQQVELGDELASVAADADQFLRISIRAKEVVSTLLMTIVRQTIANLQGETSGPRSLDSGEFVESEFLEACSAHPAALGRFHIYKQMIHYLHGDYADALADGERATQMLPLYAGLYEVTMYTFYRGLTLAAVSRDSSESSRQAYAGQLAACQASLDGWAANCPANYAHRAALLRAETASIKGDPEAAELFRQAIEAAERSEFLPDQALANLLAGRHALAQGQRDAARMLLLVARRGYARWGATALVSDLDEQNRGLLYPKAPPQERYISEYEPVAPRTADSTFDALTVLRVAQTLASEIVLTKLIEQLMRTVITHAGAQRGSLILERDGRLLVEATITHDPDLVELDLREPVETSERLATSLVHYVARTRETVVLGDASRVDRFAGDRYISQHRPKSLLCLALTHQGRLLGLLYLENNLATNVFASEQVDLIRMLSSHAAISVQNALLYANVERMTAELRASNAELGSVNQRLQAELVERERAERERSRLQEEAIQFQNARLAELSTPLIPITDKIMVMPIIGTVDRARAARVVEAALAGAHRTRAAVIILDITGLRDVDTSAIDSLMQTARALNLLGTVVILTGISPDIAQTLVNLGINLAAVVVRGTLESGIAHALERVKDGAAGSRRRL